MPPFNRIPFRIGVFAIVCIGIVLAGRVAHATEVKEVVSPGGITAWLVEDHINPIISIRFAFRGGAALDPAGKEGLARFAAALLDEGAADRDSQTFQRLLEDKSITLRFDTGLDAFRGRLITLTKHADIAVGLLNDALTAPRFDEEPVERIRRQLLAGLRQDEEDPQTQASRALFEQMFAGHPYARPTDGTLETVAGLTREDLFTFVERMMSKDALIVGVVGDVTPATLAPLLDQAFGALPETRSVETVSDVAPSLDGSVTVVDLDVPQSTILFADVGLKRNDPDFYAAYVMNYILGGGGFSSRLYEEVREKRGLAYSVGSYLYPFDHTALMLGQGGTQNARVQETIDVIRAEWSRMAEEGLSEDDLVNAKRYLTGSYPLRFTDSDRIAQMLVGLQLDGLPRTYFDIRNGLIEAVTPADIERAVKRVIDPNRLTFVVAGRPEGLSTN